MTKEKLEKLLDEFARCLHLRGKYHCQRCRYANTNLQRLGECESMLKLGQRTYRRLRKFR